MASNATSTIPMPSGALQADPKTIVGPLFVGNILNWLLLGSLAVQLYIYLNTKQRQQDPIWIQSLVYGVFVLDLVQTVTGTHACWFYAIESWGNTAVIINVIPWSAPTIPIFDGLIALLVQSFYAWRIWTLTRVQWIRLPVVLIVLVALMQCAAGWASSITVYVSSGSVSSLPVIQSSIDVWLAGSFANDMIIAACMIGLLYQARTQSPWAQSQSLYDRLIANTVQTGLLTAVVAGVDLFLWEHYKTQNFHLATAYILGKLYSNSFLSTLNGRVFRSHRSESRHETLSGSGASGNSGGMQIHVSQDRERRIDAEAGARSSFGRPKRVERKVNSGPMLDWKPAESVDRSSDEHVYALSNFSTADGAPAGKPIAV
ncbi:unnamed protein product [Peniophora sp. CBMAI 1063]|nr:unnamed protein product [Peniophora sp. CBMAI 1063]